MIRSSHRRVAARLALLLALAASLAPSRAFADGQPTAADLETARTLLGEGRARRAAHDLKGALEALKAAHALARTPITAVELAHTHVMAGELVEARELAFSVGRMPVQPDETNYSASARADAAKLADALKSRIPTLIVRVDGVAPGEVVTVTIDGAPLHAAARGQPRKVNPGKHAIAVSAERRQEILRSIEIAESETREVVLEVPPASADGPAPIAPAPVLVPTPAPAAPRKTSSPLVPIGLVTAGVGVLVGSYAGASALQSASELRAACPQRQCPESQLNALDSARTMGTISTVSFGIATAGLALAIVGFVTASPAPRVGASRVTPWVGLGSAGVRGEF